VVYNSVQGYPAGASAPLEVALFNQTANPVTVRISSTPSPEQTAGVVSARTVNLVGPAPSATATVRPPGAEPSGSAPVREKLPTGAAHVTTGPTTAPSVGAAPSATTATPGPGTTGIPAQIQIEPLDFVRFLPGSSPSLEVVGLSGTLRAGNSVNLVFEFSNGAPALTLQAPMAVPLSPAPRPTIHDNEGVAEGDHE
jgi:hypothetical protein